MATHEPAKNDDRVAPTTNAAREQPPYAPPTLVKMRKLAQVTGATKVTGPGT